MLSALAERRLGLARRLASASRDPRARGRTRHGLADILRGRMFAIACGYEDANTVDRLRADSAFKLACGRLPDTGADLCSQLTMPRIENLADLDATLVRLSGVLVDVVHGHQQLSLFDAHHDERRFLPLQPASEGRSKTPLRTRHLQPQTRS